VTEGWKKCVTRSIKVRIVLCTTYDKGDEIKDDEGMVHVA
jgi:hypothetical protein